MTKSQEQDFAKDALTHQRDDEMELLNEREKGLGTQLSVNDDEVGRCEIREGIFSVVSL